MKGFIIKCPICNSTKVDLVDSYIKSSSLDTEPLGAYHKCSNCGYTDKSTNQ